MEKKKTIRVPFYISKDDKNIRIIDREILAEAQRQLKQSHRRVPAPSKWIPPCISECFIQLEGVPVPSGSLIPEKFKTEEFYAAKEKFLRDFAYCEMMIRFSQKGCPSGHEGIYPLIQEAAYGFIPDQEFLDYVNRQASGGRMEGEAEEGDSTTTQEESRLTLPAPSTES